jgi:crotonobetainyl-CoA:carnitine CoA-transferase CaiB-like acyl-CoA transferase
VTTVEHRGPLAGVKVVEAATYMTGPYATLLLADLGADVVKVEPPTGDTFRKFGRPSTYVSPPFASMNRGKRSVVLDLKDPADKAKLFALLADADVFLSNWRAGVADSLGLTDDALEAVNPRLIRVLVTGFGLDGPASGEPAFDTAVQARSGLMDALSPSGVPVILPGYPVDKLTALVATQAVLAALYQRERTGTGERIDLAMLDVAAALDFPDLFPNRVFVDHQPDDPHNQHLFTLRPLPASDGYVVIAPAASRHMRAAFEAVGHPEWADEVLAIPGQAALIDAFFDRIVSVTPSDTVEHWLARFRAHDVACAPCTTMDEHLVDPQIEHNDVYRTAQWDDAGTARYVRYPAVFKSWGHLVDDRPPPRLGADTDTVVGD